jgi:DNA-binding PadR family transcriptional regulator
MLTRYSSMATETANDMTAVEYWQSLNRRSLLRFFLFAALYERPMHGYEIANAVAVCCDGGRPTDAMVYPMLKELEAEGYVECEVESNGARQRKVCTLTEKGVAAFRAAAQAWGQAMPQIEAAVHAAGVSACCEQETDAGGVAEVTFAEMKR